MPLRKILPGILLLVLPVLSGAETELANIASMHPIDNGNTVYSDGEKAFLVIFSDFYKKKVSAFREVRPKAGYQFVSGQCYQNGRFDESIVALVKPERDKEKWIDVAGAWVVDKSRSVITPVEPRKIFCMNDAWGV